tara:strand:- start:1802 stop:2455 length:654 start_codon:yes stop_codon:yes gene_type:complete
MKQFLILILLFFSAFEIKAQRDYESPDAKQKVLSHKNFAIVPFNFKVTGRKPRKMTQEEYERNILNAEKDARLSCQAEFASRILKKLQKGKIVSQLQPVARTNALLSRAGITSEDLESSKYLPEELCEILEVDAVVLGSVESSKLLSTGASIGLAIIGLNATSGKSSADLSLYDKDAELLWNWSTRELKTNSIGSDTQSLIDYLMKRATKKFPYFQR